MKRINWILLLIFAANLGPGYAFAQNATAAAEDAFGTQGTSQMQKDSPSDSLIQNAQRGWFFYEHPKKPPAPASAPENIQPEAEPQTARPQSKEERCKNFQTWTADCGFVDPGKSFEFQSKERDALLQGMAMSQNDPKAVESFQYYQKWVLDRSIEIANLWYYNTVQNPQLDANVKAPINTFGLKLMTEVKDSNQASVLDLLKKQGAFYIYFSRHDCTFCQSMLPVINRLSNTTGLEVWNAALDDTCLSGYEKRCLAGEPVQKPAQDLQVTIVPTMFLYVPPNTWIRIANGVTDDDTMIARTTSFFSAYRTALIKGTQNTNPGVAPVDFSGDDPTGAAAGVPTSGKARLPTEDEIQALLAK